MMTYISKLWFHFSTMKLLDNKVKSDVHQYLHSLNTVSLSKDLKKYPKKDINIDPLIHQIYDTLS